MKAIGIILAGGKNERLNELTTVRATSAMPVGSCYRAIDFTLSNMSNSNIKKVAVITQFNSRSLNDHLSSSKWWDFGSMQGGLFIFTPFLSKDNNYWFRGTADSIYQNLNYLLKSNEQYVVIASGDGIYKFDYNEILEYHAKKDADITIMCKDMGDKCVKDYGVVEIDDDSRVLDFEEKPVDPQSSFISLGIYVISRTLLIDLLTAALKEERYDFVKDIIIRYRKKLKIYSFIYDGYWSTVNNIESYYNINMDFLKKDVREHLVTSEPHIETKPKDEPPAKYNAGAEVTDALVGSGSILNGKVNHSVLFRNVFVGENTSVENSIIMERCYIGNNCFIKDAILDKEVILSDGKSLIGKPDDILIVKKGTVV